MILALDIATRMGWSMGEPGAVPDSGSVRFGGNDASDWARFNDALRLAIDQFEIRGVSVDTLTIEDQLDPRPFSVKQAAVILCGLPPIIRAVAYECGVYDIRKRAVADVRGLQAQAFDRRGESPRRARLQAARLGRGRSQRRRCLRALGL
jgi:hypothetical protein